MAHGHEDFNQGVGIDAQEIADLDVDITAQTIANLAVDIAAQSLANLDININKQDLAEVAVDIAAQTVGNLGVDITAQSVGDIAVEIASQTLTEVGISIDAQTLANLDMNINAQSIGVDDSQVRSIRQGNQRSFRNAVSGVTDGTQETMIDETVPAGETWYANIASWGARNAGAVEVDLLNFTDSVYYLAASGNAGGVCTFPSSPEIGSGGDRIFLLVTNCTGSTTTLDACLHIWYE